MEGPWFLQALGLPPYADVAAVRRAYAQALRRIDPSADPDGFARLREAYETARAWCEQVGAEEHDADTPSHEAASQDAQAEGGNTGTDESAPSAGSDARREAALLTEAFVSGVRTGDAAHAVDLLERTIAELRTRYIDAPGELEERLIDLIAGQDLPHRAALFDAATALFHWEDIGQLAPLGERGQWVEAVIVQQSLWMQGDPVQRRQWLDPVIRAAVPIDAPLAGHWPVVDRLCTQYPQWIGLHLHHTVARAWKASFEALATPVQQKYRQKATTQAKPRAPAKVRRRFSLPWFGLVIALGALSHLGQAIFNDHGLATFSLPWSGQDDTPETCADLYRQLSRKDAFAGITDRAVRELTHRGEQCERNGYWHPVPRTDSH
ncbi:hypothetical protein GCM10009552_33170 [Rothia nasimurium]|uniref:J domain-containing protein n=1 Tax=Luteibacter anthropi TaxID=564369 RepID=A0A7X5UD67_9GAMM|nr:hypothetical protein [Luteibacter anthropi]NII08048.1 hypothetical protein [Luteibacter anthropi]